MLERSTELTQLGLQPLIKQFSPPHSETLKKNKGIESFAFCEVDSDLQPRDKIGDPKKPLVTFYDQAAIWPRIKPISVAAGFGNIGWRTFRHSFSSWRKCNDNLFPTAPNGFPSAFEAPPALSMLL
jgi:hypothetical protein